MALVAWLRYSASAKSHIAPVVRPVLDLPGTSHHNQTTEAESWYLWPEPPVPFTTVRFHLLNGQLSRLSNGDA